MECRLCFSIYRTTETSLIQEHGVSWLRAGSDHGCPHSTHLNHIPSLPFILPSDPECENKTQIYTANILLSNLEIDCNKERTMGVNVYFYLHKRSCWEIWGQKSAAALVLIIVWSLGLMECEAGLALRVYLLILSSQESFYMMVL